MTVSLAAIAKNAEANATAALVNSGFLNIYSGTAPATADTALSGNTLLAQLTFGATAFGAASGGIATANAITQDSSADATGTATFYRVTKSDGSVVQQGSVTATGGGGDMQLNSTAIQVGTVVQVTSFTYTRP